SQARISLDLLIFGTTLEALDLIEHIDAALARKAIWLEAAGEVHTFAAGYDVDGDEKRATVSAQVDISEKYDPRTYIWTVTGAGLYGHVILILNYVPTKHTPSIKKLNLLGLLTLITLEVIGKLASILDKSTIYEGVHVPLYRDWYFVSSILYRILNFYNYTDTKKN
ncbi:hypothetical protein ACJX0J_035251, partial [Zea mays]